MTVFTSCDVLMSDPSGDAQQTPSSTSPVQDTAKPSEKPIETTPERAETSAPERDEPETTEPETVHTHAWGDWRMTKEATCTDAGVSERACACGETEMQSMEPAGHIPGAEATCTDPQNCTACGEELASANGHTPGDEATCTAAQTCLVCGTELTAAKGHTEVTDAAVAPTVTETGLSEGKHCSACNKVLVQQETVPATGSIGLAYELNDGGTAYIVTGIGTCGDSVVYIPEVYDGLPVNEISRRAFYNCATITEITIPTSIKTIGTQIFYKAENLHTVYYNSSYGSNGNPFFSQSSVEKIVFGGKAVPGYVLYDCFGVVDVVISDGVTSIGDNAFSGCTGLTSITIPDSVKRIGYYAFNGCTGLTSIVIPDSVTSIGIYAFSGCSALTAINIPEGVTSINSYAFDGCFGLTSVTIPDSVTSIGDGAFDGCSGLTSITIPDSVTSIGHSAFEGCTSLTSIVIPDSVTSIEYATFSDCTSLTSITIPDSVTGIGSAAFCRCTSLTSIVIPDSVRSIGRFTFEKCTDLTTVVIPDSVTVMGDQAFDNCTSLTSIRFEGTVAQWSGITKGYKSAPVTEIICSDGVVSLN